MTHSPSSPRATPLSRVGSDNSEPILNIVGERVGLGPIEREHLPLFQHWFNDMQTLRTAGVGVNPMTIEQVTGWIGRITAAGDAAWFMVYELASTRAIGFAGLRDIDHRHRTAEYAITIGEADMRGQGYGAEATRLMLDYAFTALGLHNVLLDTTEYNLAGRRAYEKAGFREIGRRRESDLLAGRLWDTVFMEALSTNFESQVLGEIFVPDEQR